MKKVILFISVSILVISTSCTQKSGDAEAKDAAISGISEPLNDAKLAGELAVYGYTNNSALALAQAAEILCEMDIRNLEVTKSEEGAKNENTGEKKGKVTLNVDTLLADAAIMASDDTTLLALVDGVKKIATAGKRGRTYGPAAVERTVSSNSSYTDYIKFDGSALAEIVIVGDGDTDLDIYVYDENDNLIVKDDDNLDICYVSWYPRYTSTFKVKIINRGSVYNKYTLITN